MRALPLSLAFAAVLAVPALARADHDNRPSEEAPSRPEFASSLLFERPHTIALLELGVIALPTAPISVANRGGSTPFGTIGSGDATLNAGMHLLYQGGRDWAVGAAAFFAPSPTSDSAYAQDSPNGSTTPRTHSRSYLFIGLEGRYYPLRYRWFQAWAGLAAGGIIIRDVFTNDAAESVPGILGTRDLTVRSEGFAVGVQAGADYLLTDHWVLGVSLRADRWILPTATSDRGRDPSCSSLGDCPTITGTVEAFMFGLTAGYRIQL